MGNISSHMIDRCQSYLDTATASSEFSKQLAGHNIVNTHKSNELIQYGKEMLRVNREFAMVNYADTQGNFVMAKRMPDGSFSAKIIRRGEKQARVVWQHENPDWEKDFSNTEESLDTVYDPRKRPWYIQAIKKKNLIWTNVYIFYSDQRPGITCANPVYDEKGELLGVVGIDISFAELSYFLSKLNLGKEGKAFILNGSDEIIAFPVKKPEALQDLVKTKVDKGTKEYQLIHVENVNDPVIAATFTEVKKKIKSIQDWKERLKKIKGSVEEKNYQSYFTEASSFLSEETINVSFAHSGKRYITMYRPFPADTIWNWTIAVVMPEEDFMKGVYWSNTVSLVISLFCVGIAVLFGFYLSKKISLPLAQLEKEMDKVKNFELDSQSNVTSFIKEVDSMASTFEKMKTSLKSFEKFVPSDIVGQLLDKGQEAVLGGEKKELTIYFSDIVGFTSISEKMSPEELVEDLAVYLENMSSIICKHQGTVDKYIGDAIMAFWGAPNPVENHALMACKSALECQEELDNLCQKWAKEGKTIFQARIGLNSGEAIVGNMGSSNRLNYTVIGDTVNLASRYEGINKYYGTKIIIGEETYQATKEHMLSRLVDFVAVKGKSKGTPIYELIGEYTKVTTEQKHFAKVFDEGVKLYQERRWEEAIANFTQASQIVQNDLPSTMFIERCQHYQENPPGEDWNGILKLKKK